MSRAAATQGLAAAWAVDPTLPGEYEIRRCRLRGLASTDRLGRMFGVRSGIGGVAPTLADLPCRNGAREAAGPGCH
jgi:hypothetical protein